MSENVGKQGDAQETFDVKRRLENNCVGDFLSADFKKKMYLPLFITPRNVKINARWSLIIGDLSFLLYISFDNDYIVIYQKNKQPND